MKPGDLERSLSRLAGLARRARERMNSLDEQVAELRTLLEAAAPPLCGDPERDEDAIEGANPTRAPTVAQAEVLFK